LLGFGWLGLGWFAGYGWLDELDGFLGFGLLGLGWFGLMAVDYGSCWLTSCWLWMACWLWKTSC
jgi:hypothetical protein